MRGFLGRCFTSGVGFGGVPLAGEGRGVEIGFGASWFDGECGLEVGVGVIKFAGPARRCRHGCAFPVSAPEPGWRRPEKAEKDGTDFVQAVDYLLAWALVFPWAGCPVTLVSIPAGLLGRVSFLEPGLWAKDLEKYSPAARSGRVSTD